MGNFNLKNIEFCKQALLQKISRPLPVIALYPKNSADTKLYVQVIDNATVIAIRYVASVTTNESITFVGRSVEDVVQSINQLNLPIRAATIHDTLYLKQGDIVSPGSGFMELPGNFTAYDRVDNSGIVLRAKRIAVRHKANSKIRTLSPYSESPSLPWYPRITNGSFSQKYNNKLYHFYIPEFTNQSWSTQYGKPFKDLYGVQPVIKELNVYQLPRYPVYWDGQNITLYNGNVPISNSVVEDIDINNGLLYIKPGTYLQDNFSVDYTYLETTYVYKDLNINGHFSQNPLMLDKYIVMYVLPAESNQGIRKKTVFHVVADSIDQAIDSIQLEDASTPIAIIGAYNIQQVFSSDKISMLDTRGKGGGLINNNGPKSPIHTLDPSTVSDEVPIEELYQEAYRFWDLGNFDGEAYPGAAVVAVDLPIDLQDVLSISDIKKKTSKFMAAGVYPSIQFTKRDLPSVTGLSAQTSCAFNLNFSLAYTGTFTQTTGVYSTIPSVFTGGGWLLEEYSNPSSILSGNWNSFNPTFNISSSIPRVIEVNTSTGLVMPYLKSTPWAGVSWEEREIVYNEGSVKDPISFTPWKEVKYYDSKTALTGQLVKSYVSLDPENVTKQYRNISINSPIHTGDLVRLLEDSVSNIIDNTLQLQAGLSQLNGTVYGTEIVSGYTTVTDKDELINASDFTLVSDLYTHFFKMEDTPLEDTYYETLYKIGEDFILSGTYSSGHYFKPYIQNIHSYVTVDAADQPYINLDYNKPLKTLNNYLNMRTRKGTWSDTCSSGVSASTGLIGRMMSSTLSSGPFVGGVPLYWTYYPLSDGFSQDLLSGFLFEASTDIGGSLSEVSPDYNYDYLYNFSLPALMSACLANSGEDISNSHTLAALTGVYGLTVENTIANINQALTSERTLSGLPTTSHWFVGHNRLGTYLGNTLFNMIEAYSYVNKYNRSRDRVSDVSSPAGVSLNYMDYMFSGIETVLEAGYDAVYHNVLRGGIVEPDMCLTMYAYGWYLNNWSKNYGVKSKTYATDKRSKYHNLFNNGLKQLVKGHVTPDGELLETTTVYGEAGPFPASTVSKLLYPLGQALEYNYSEWAGVSEGIVNTLVNQYSIDGLYYQDPYLASSAAGKENDVLGGLIEMYKSVSQTGTYTYWETMNTGLHSLRGTEFLPPFDSYLIPPVDGWSGVTNSLSLWKYYNSGDVSTSITTLKNAGINTIELPLDYIYWKQDSTEFHNKLAHTLSECYSNRIRVIPTIMEGGSVEVVSGQEADYVTTFGHTGGRYYYGPIKQQTFMSGVFSGSTYINELLTSYDSDPAIIAWNITNKPVNSLQATINYNTIAYYIKEYTTTPVIYTIDTNPSISDFIGYSNQAGDNDNTDAIVEVDDIYNLVPPLFNPNIDFIGISPDSTFTYPLDRLTGTISKPKILTRYGNGTYGDYSKSILRATDRTLPFTLSNFFVTSGQNNGNLYLDGTSRNVKQLSQLRQAAAINNVYPTGIVQQVTQFQDKYFYPTGYIPVSNGDTILEELYNWTNRLAFNSSNSGEIYRQVDILSAAQLSLSTLDYVHSWPESQYYMTKELSVEECGNLNYYGTTWESINVFNSSASHWTLSGLIDYDRYNTFLDNWGTFLSSVSSRLNING